MNSIPRIKKAFALENYKLRVLFVNGIEKIYDCHPLISNPQFHMLKNPVFFRAVNVDAGGYGISWSDSMDVSEYELWTNGREIFDK